MEQILIKEDKGEAEVALEFTIDMLFVIQNHQALIMTHAQALQLAQTIIDNCPKQTAPTSATSGLNCIVCGEKLSGRMEVLTGKCEDC